MQEDGLEILKTILYGDYQVTSKNAAAYGLRKMHGRMKKMAEDVLKEGMKQHNGSTRDICRNALQLLGYKIPEEFLPKKRAARRTRIKDIPGRTRSRRIVGTR
jgi:hypothetical protein